MRKFFEGFADVITILVMIIFSLLLLMIMWSLQSSSFEMYLKNLDRNAFYLTMFSSISFALGAVFVFKQLKKIEKTAGFFTKIKLWMVIIVMGLIGIFPIIEFIKIII